MKILKLLSNKWEAFVTKLQLLKKITNLQMHALFINSNHIISNSSRYANDRNLGLSASLHMISRAFT